VGDRIHIKGHTTDLQQVLESMQIEHQSVQEAGPGDSVGIRVQDRCRSGDSVYRVSE
jgi:putative protease